MYVKSPQNDCFNGLNRGQEHVSTSYRSAKNLWGLFLLVLWRIFDEDLAHEGIDTFIEQEDCINVWLLNQSTHSRAVTTNEAKKNIL